MKAASFFNRNHLPYYLTLAFLGVVILLLSLFQPCIAEEASWHNRVLPFLQNPSFDTFCDTAGSYLAYQWNYDNVRIAQVPGFFLFYLPYWVICFITGLVAAWMFWTSAKLCGVWRSNGLLYSLLCFAFVLMLPWYGEMYCTVWQLNYTLPSALWAFTIYKWLGTDKPLSPVPAFILGFLTGWAHEQYAAVLVAGAAVIFVMYKAYRDKTTLAIIVGALIPVVVGCLSPASSYRYDHGFSGIAIFRLIWWIYNFMTIPTVCLIIAVVCIPRLRRRCLTPLFVCVAASALGAIAVSAKFGILPRVAWAPTLCGIVLFVIFFRYLDLPKLKYNNIVAGIIWWVIAAQYIYSIHVVFQYIHLMSELDKQPEHPTLFIKYPDNDLLTVALTAKKIGPTYNIRELEVRSAFPLELKDFSPEKSDTIKSNLPDTKVYYYDGFIIVKFPDPHIKYSDIHTYRGNACIAHQANFPRIVFDSDTFNMVSPARRTLKTIPFRNQIPDSIVFIKQVKPFATFD